MFIKETEAEIKQIFSFHCTRKRMVFERKNGELLKLAESEFGVLLTADQIIESQQNLSCFYIAVVALVAPQNKLEMLLPLMYKLRSELQKILPHQLVYSEH